MNFSTQLKTRVLRYDGISIISPEDVCEALLLNVKPSQIRVTSVNEEIVSFNTNVDDADHISVECEEPLTLDYSWNIPEKYKVLDIDEAVGKVFEQRAGELFPNYSKDQWEHALTRVVDELHEIKIRGMTDFFRTIIYILDVFREKDVVWGVGRGSSCASYILFLLNLHSVDAILYNIPLDEFFHD